MGNTVTEADKEEIRRLAGAGDEAAKAALAALPQESEPESGKAEPVEDVKVGTEEKPEETSVEKTESKTESQVDQAQEKSESRKREMHPAARRIEREKREMRRIVEQQRQELEALKKAVEAAQPRKPEVAETDELNKLLTNPKAYLEERDRQLIERVTKQSAAEQKRIAQELARTQIERENALKILSSIEGYDDKRDYEAILSATADYLNDVYDTDRYDEEEVLQLWQEQPSTIAPVMKKAWKKSRQLPDEVKSDKKAATSAQTGAGKPSGGKTPSLNDLNAKLSKTTDKGDQNKIIEQIAELLGEKK